MSDIKDVVAQVIQGIVSKKIDRNNLIQEKWLQILDKKSLERARIVEFNEGILVVHVDSPAWLYQMNLQKGKILSELKKDVSEINSIIFRIGKV